MLLSKLGEEGRAMFGCGANLFGDQVRRSPVGRRKEPPLLWQGEVLIVPSSEFFDGGRGKAA